MPSRWGPDPGGQLVHWASQILSGGSQPAGSGVADPTEGAETLPIMVFIKPATHGTLIPKPSLASRSATEGWPQWAAKFDRFAE